MKTIIAFGSNMGEKQQYIEKALKQMEEKVGKTLAVSSVIESEPYGYTEQDNFLNGAVLIETELAPYQLLDVLHEIEADLDRVRLIHWGPRTIDLDIIFYDDLIMDEEDLHIPHIDFANRTFVLGPICEIAPDLVDPRSGKTVRQLYEKLLENNAAD